MGAMDLHVRASSMVLERVESKEFAWYFRLALRLHAFEAERNVKWSG